MPYNLNDYLEIDLTVNLYNQTKFPGSKLPPPLASFLLNDDGDNLLDDSGEELLTP